MGFISDKDNVEQLKQGRKTKNKAIGKLSELREFTEKYRINMILLLILSISLKKIQSSCWLYVTKPVYV